ncbi:MAG: hypothetical protein AAFQ80_15560 [Cyanobacteria bacterium J06621_8]
MNKIQQRWLAFIILLAGLRAYLPIYQQLLSKFQKSPVVPCQRYSKAKLRSPKIASPPPELALPEINHHHHRLTSPTEKIGMAVSPNKQYIYELTATGIKLSDRISGSQQIYPLPPNFPQLSWATDLAYDSKRDVVALVSYGGSGYFYRFDVKNRRWLGARSLEGVDLQTLTYDATFDRYLAWSESFVGKESKLWFLSSDGELQFAENLGDRLPGYHQLYNRGYEPNPQVEIIANGHHLALIARQNPRIANNVAELPITAIWHYDRLSNKINLSYKEPRRLYSD